MVEVSFQAEKIDRLVNEEFGFRSGDQNVWGDVELEAIEVCVLGEVGNRLVVCTAADEIAVGGTLFVGGALIMTEVEVDTLTFQYMSKEDIRTEAGLVDAKAGQEVAGPIQKAFGGPGGILGFNHNKHY